MATYTFKNAIFRNVGTLEQVIYTPPTGKNSIVIQLDIANITAGAATATAYIKRSGLVYNIILNGSMIAGESLQVVYGQKIVLMDGDSLCVTGSASPSVDVICSVVEDV